MHQKIDTTSAPPEVQPRTLKQSLASAVAMSRKRDVIHVGNKPAEPRLGPTPEQRAKVDYERGGGKIDKGIVGAAAYQRQPLFEKLAKTHGISAAGIAALRFYRAVFEAQDSSPTRCTLNDEGRGGGLPLCLPYSISDIPLEFLSGGTVLDSLERRLGHTLTTMRAVALEDQSFSAVAIARFGSRVVPYIEQERRRPRNRKGEKLRYVDKVVPISGRHRQIIADEFDVGLARLVEAHSPHVTTARPIVKPAPAAQPIAPPSEAEMALNLIVNAAAPSVDPAFIDEGGRFKQWGEIAEIIRSRALSIAPPEAPDRR